MLSAYLCIPGCSATNFVTLHHCPLINYNTIPKLPCFGPLSLETCITCCRLTVGPLAFNENFELAETFPDIRRVDPRVGQTDVKIFLTFQGSAKMQPCTHRYTSFVQ